MNWLKKRIVSWLNSSPSPLADALVSSREVEVATPGDFNMSFFQAMNGKVIQIRTYAPHKNPGPDWKTEYYIVPDGERITDALAVLMIAKNLDKA